MTPIPAVSPEHAAALVAHLSDLLSADADVARSLLVEIVGESPVYQDLVCVTLEAVAEAARSRGVGATAIKRVAAAALIAGVDPAAPTCNRCGRMPLRLVGAATWVRVEGAVCPVDQGLYVSRERSAVVSWVDGRGFPAGTTHDDARVPLTERAILDARKVDARVASACAETGAGLLDVLASLVRGGKTAAQALAVVVAPDAEFIDEAALRAFVARSKGCLKARGTTATPAAPSAPAPAGDTAALRRTLVRLYPEAVRTQRVATEAGLDCGRIRLEGSAEDRWFEVLNEAHRQGLVDAVVTVARAEYPTAFQTPSAASLVERLCRCVPAQFDKIVFLLGVQTSYLPGPMAPQAERATALVRLVEQQGKMAQLHALVSR